MKGVRVTFICDASLVESAKKACVANDTTVSRVLRDALRRFVADHRQPELPLSSPRPKRERS